MAGIFFYDVGANPLLPETLIFKILLCVFHFNRKLDTIQSQKHFQIDMPADKSSGDAKLVKVAPRKKRKPPSGTNSLLFIFTEVSLSLW